MPIKQIILPIALYTILINHHAIAMHSRTSDRYAHRYPSQIQLIYKYNSTRYEMQFKQALIYELACLKAEGKSEDYLKNREECLLKSLQEQKNEILTRIIRKTYYPKKKPLEWKNNNKK